MPVAVIILFITLVAIALRRVARTIIPIWAIMAFGAIAALLCQQITPVQAIAAIEADVMAYLLGVFFIAQAAEESGYLEQLTHNIFYHACTGKHALFIVVFILGTSAALLMNDTVAIIGTPIILQLCKSHKSLIKPLLFALAFSVTIGSALSPVGNPQNLLIAVKGEMMSPFLDFFMPLAIPTILNLIICYLLIYVVYKDRLEESLEKAMPMPIRDFRTVALVKLSLIMMICLVFTKVIMDFAHTGFRINFSYIALISAIPLLLSKQKWLFLRKLDWGTLIFFASTFVLMQSVWNSGFFQANIHHYHMSLISPMAILVISVLLSQFISNVPLVALYLPLLMQAEHSNLQLLTLAVGSTIGGNLSILGAASTIIIIQNSEKRGIKGFGFLEFIKLGLPLTTFNILVYVCFFKSY